MKRTFLFSSVLLLAAWFVGAPAAAKVRSFMVDAKTSKVGFTAHTSMFDVDGSFKKWNADVSYDPSDLSTAKFTVRIQTKSVDTGIEKRDEHLVEEDFFASNRYPAATFRSTGVKVRSPGKLEIQGVFTLRGKSKPLTFPAIYRWKEKDGGRALRISGSVQITRQDFDVNYKAGLLLPEVADQVELSFDVTVLP